jgi:hypothetical protein
MLFGISEAYFRHVYAKCFYMVDNSQEV